MPARGPWIDHFGENFLWSNATLILKGMAPYGVVALGEIDRCCERLRARENEPDRGKAWHEEWSGIGSEVEKRGDGLGQEPRHDRRRLLPARGYLPL